VVLESMVLRKICGWSMVLRKICGVGEYGAEEDICCWRI
jgi:hypothetical protein